MREKKLEKTGSEIFKNLLIEVKLGYPPNLSSLGHLELPEKFDWGGVGWWWGGGGKHQ